MQLNVQLLSDNAKLPVYSSDGAAGLDLFSASYGKIEPGERALIKTDIAIEIPAGWYGQIHSRSGLAYKENLDVCAGVIDCDYRGNVGVVLHNCGKLPFYILEGDRIAQLILKPAPQFELKVVDKLSDSIRGEGAYGSTGK